MKSKEEDINLISASCQNNRRLVNDDESRCEIPCARSMRHKEAKSSIDLSMSTSSLLKQDVSTKSTMGSLDEISVGTTIDSSLMRPLSSAYLRKYSYLTIEDITTVNEDQSFVSDDDDYFDFIKTSTSDDLCKTSQGERLGLLQLTPPATESSESEIFASSLCGFSSSDITRRIHDTMLLSDPSTYPAFRDTKFSSTQQFCDETSISMLIPSLDSSSLQDASTSTTHFGDQETDSTASASDAPTLNSIESSGETRTLVSEFVQSDTLCSDVSSDFSLLDAINSLSDESSTSSPNAMFSYIRDSTSTANVTVSTNDASPLLTSPNFNFWVGDMTPRPGMLSLTDPRGTAPWSKVKRRVRFAKSPERVTISRSALSRKLDRQLQSVSLKITRANAAERGRKTGNIFLKKSVGETEFLKTESTSVEPTQHLIVKVPRKPESQSYLNKRRIKKSSVTPVFQRLTTFQKKVETKHGGGGEVRRIDVKEAEWSPTFGRFIVPPKPPTKEESPVFLRLIAPQKKKDTTNSWNMKTRKSFEDSPVFHRLTSVPKRQSKNTVPPLSLLIRLARKNRFKNMIEKRSSSYNIAKISHAVHTG